MLSGVFCFSLGRAGLHEPLRLAVAYQHRAPVGPAFQSVHLVDFGYMVRPAAENVRVWRECSRWINHMQADERMGNGDPVCGLARHVFRAPAPSLRSRSPGAKQPEQPGRKVDIIRPLWRD